MENKEYVATFKTSIQISPDDFKVVNPSMRCDSKTTISDIEQWFREHLKTGALEVTIIELEK